MGFLRVPRGRSLGTVRTIDSRYLSQISWTSPLTYTRADGQNACCRTDLGSNDHSGGRVVFSGGRIVDGSDGRERFPCVLRSISEWRHHDMGLRAC